MKQHATRIESFGGQNVNEWYLKDKERRESEDRKKRLEEKLSEQKSRQKPPKTTPPAGNPPPSPPQDFSTDFSITDEGKYWRTTGINGKAYDVSKELLCNGESHEQQYWFKHRKKAGIDDFCCPTGPELHAIIKSWYENRNNSQYSSVIESARQQFAQWFKDYYLMTVSRIDYKHRGLDEVVHYNNRSVKANIVGPGGLIKSLKPNEELESLLQAKDWQEVQDVYEWMTGKDSKLWRLNNKPATTTSRALVLGVSVGGGFGIVAVSVGVVVGYGPAVGVRSAKNFSTGSTGNEGGQK